MFRLRDTTWVPSALDAVAAKDEVKLTAGSAYGGCGAKLSKGLLEKVLCGLPRLESEDVLVGIEYADDAGVIRVSPDIAIIHTTDFFPPMVDDPYTFGRIAAVNALSDVWAMGGTVLAAMNLVSYPLSKLGREALTEILRGGLSALEEAGGVLAGGHTVEGQELLYGLAVTGTVHPDRIWRNAGALAGDVLVLTKPLGTGVLTTAAKAEMVDPNDLSTALRWMATLNRKAADALHDAAPHAVTDVTGFGLAGHVAEMAEASGDRRRDRSRGAAAAAGRPRGRGDGSGAGRRGQEPRQRGRGARGRRGRRRAPGRSLSRPADLGRACWQRCYPSTPTTSSAASPAPPSSGAWSKARQEPSGSPAVADSRIVIVFNAKTQRREAAKAIAPSHFARRSRR